MIITPHLPHRGVIGDNLPEDNIPPQMLIIVSGQVLVATAMTVIEAVKLCQHHHIMMTIARLMLMLLHL